MSINSISTQSLNEAPRQATVRMQRDLTDTQVEASTGRLADVTLSLGADVKDSISVRGQLAGLASLQQSTSLASGRLEASQNALGSMVSDANKFIGSIIAARSNRVGQQTSASEASNYMKSFGQLANTTYAGAYVFGGLKTDTSPMPDYSAQPTSAAKTAVDNAFQSFFGFSQSDPAAANITSASMASFLNGPFSTLFANPSWSNWSSASSTNLKQRIGPDEVVETSTNVNGQPFRDLAMAYTMMSDLGGANLSAGAFSVVADRAILSLSAAVEGLGVTQSNLGAIQERMTTAQDVHSKASSMLEKQIASSESVDQYSAATHLNQLTTQLEAAYQITARIQKLSILNYI